GGCGRHPARLPPVRAPDPPARRPGRASGQGGDRDGGVLPDAPAPSARLPASGPQGRGFPGIGAGLARGPGLAHVLGARGLRRRAGGRGDPALLQPMTKILYVSTSTTLGGAEKTVYTLATCVHPKDFPVVGVVSLKPKGHYA